MRNAVHHDFDGSGHLLFHFLGRAPRPLRDDLDVVVRHVRIRFHRQVMERDGAPDQQKNRERDNQDSVV
jgi:hypothetical protein